MRHGYVGGRQKGTHDKVCMHVQPSVQTTTTIGVLCGPQPARWSVAALDARFDARYRRNGCNTSLIQANDLDECLTQTSFVPQPWFLDRMALGIAALLARAPLQISRSSSAAAAGLATRASELSDKHAARGDRAILRNASSASLRCAVSILNSLGESRPSIGRPASPLRSVSPRRDRSPSRSSGSADSESFSVAWLRS